MANSRRLLLGLALQAALLPNTPHIAWAEAPKVSVLRVPHAGIQPQLAVDEQGALHLVYFKGDPRAGDIYYVRSTDDGATFSAPLRVNSQAGSAIAVGNIRGAQLAIGRHGRVHVAWNGSSQALPKGLANPGMPGTPSVPMLYTRLNDAGTAFEPQRNLMRLTFNLDGGGSVAADKDGNVYVAWHANTGDEKGEGERRVWMARSADDGKTFSPESPVWDKPTGACGCCALRVATGQAGQVEILYRSATQMENRDTYLLRSTDRGAHFEGVRVHPWKINSCPMSSFAFADQRESRLAAWESEEQVYYASFDPAALRVAEPTGAPGTGRRRKYPVLAADARGDVLLAWAEGMGWSQGGAVAWQVFDPAGQPVAGAAGRLDGVPAWSLAAAYANRDGGFTVIY